MNKTLNLRADIDKLPIYFSQVREDPRLDEEVIKSIGRPCRVLMIASGGDSVCYLATLDKVTSIDAVDGNSSQISLNKLKLSLLKFSPENRFRILGHEQMDSDIRHQIITEICRENNISISDFGPAELTYESGLDFTGRYEQLFIGIQRELSIRGLKPSDLLTKPLELKCVFREYFDLDLLVKIFGKEATQNPRQSFSEHFLEQACSFINSPQSLNSPFLNQMLYGTFGSEVYEWLKLPALNSSDINPVMFHHSLMIDYLFKADDESYDFIHLSNILDWLSEQDASALLRQVFRVLKRGGKILIRQLNSSLNIECLEGAFQWDQKFSEELTRKDQSFFYRKVLVGGKVS
ncbi:MAG: BtaA family protein [Lentisphaeraceae bacterium]|nr:BtaA family protein [Lentisphaeraceae bacterium]